MLLNCLHISAMSVMPVIVLNLPWIPATYIFFCSTSYSSSWSFCLRPWAVESDSLIFSDVPKSPVVTFSSSRTFAMIVWSLEFLLRVTGFGSYFTRINSLFSISSISLLIDWISLSNFFVALRNFYFILAMAPSAFMLSISRFLYLDSHSWISCSRFL